MEKSKTEKGDWQWGTEGCNFKKGDQGGPYQAGGFWAKFEGGEEESYEDVWGKGISDRGSASAKVQRLSLTHTFKEFHGGPWAGEEQAKGKGGREVASVARDQTL